VSDDSVGGPVATKTGAMTYYNPSLVPPLCFTPGRYLSNSFLYSHAMNAVNLLVNWRCNLDPELGSPPGLLIPVPVIMHDGVFLVDLVDDAAVFEPNLHPLLVLPVSDFNICAL